MGRKKIDEILSFVPNENLVLDSIEANRLGISYGKFSAGKYLGYFRSIPAGLEPASNIPEIIQSFNDKNKGKLI